MVYLYIMATKATSRRKASPTGLKFPEVREKIRQLIRSGKYAPGSRLPTETEISRRMKVNPRTVSRALTDLVSEGLVVRRRGSGTYVADRTRPPLVHGRNLRLGLLSRNEMRPEYLAENSVDEFARGALSGWGMEESEAEWRRDRSADESKAIWHSHQRGATVVGLGEGPQSVERAPQLERVAAERFDGLICLSIINEDWLERLMTLGIPTVLVDFPNERFVQRADQVFADPAPAYRKAVRHFASKGYERIHFVGSYITAPAPDPEMTREEWRAFTRTTRRVDPDCYLRQSAYRQAMEECGLPAGEDRIHCIRADAFYGEELGGKLAELPKEQQPQAVVCHGIAQADGAIKAFSERDLELEGVGSTTGPATDRALAVRFDAFELGAVAAELLVSRLQRPERRLLKVGVQMEFISPETTI